MSNTPTLMQSEEKKAPWNERTKIIEVNISQTLSCTQYIEVPEDFDESDNKALEELVKQQIVLPSDLIYENRFYCWVEDDFCVL